MLTSKSLNQLMDIDAPAVTFAALSDGTKQSALFRG